MFSQTLKVEEKKGLDEVEAKEEDAENDTYSEKYQVNGFKEREENAMSLEPRDNCIPSMVKSTTRNEREERDIKRSHDEPGQFERGGKRTRTSTAKGVST